MTKQLKNSISNFETLKIKKENLNQIKGGNDDDNNPSIVIEEEIVN